MALLFLRVQDYPTLRLDAATGARSAGSMLRELFRARSGSAGYTGGAVQLVVVSTIYTWLPSQLNRAYGLPVDRAAAATALVILAGFAGMIGFAHLAELPAPRCGLPQARLAGSRRDGGAHRRPAHDGVRCSRSWSGPVSPDPRRRRDGDRRGRADVGRGGRRRASGAARDGYLDAWPWCRTSSGSRSARSSRGWLSDRYGLTTALAVLPLLCVVSAAMFWYGSRFYERDRAAVPVAAGPPAPTTARARAAMTAVVVPRPAAAAARGAPSGSSSDRRPRSPRLTPPE